MESRQTKQLAAGSIVAAASLAGLAAPVAAQDVIVGPPVICDKCDGPGGQTTAFDTWDALAEIGVFIKFETVAFPKVESSAFPKLEDAFNKVETHALFYKLGNR